MGYTKKSYGIGNMMTNHGILGYLSRQTHMGAGQNNSTPKRMVLYCIVRMDQCCGSLDGTHKNHINKVLECKTVATSAPEKPCFEIGSVSHVLILWSFKTYNHIVAICCGHIVVILWSGIANYALRQTQNLETE